ncbi:hypothetical protein GE061_003381 [Apolygus lucorum]|uniref:FLYWCH-type domain-containing protein n=1 Tax=Apolygus lucorum TaxID=248454 RepID=A0A8S9X3R5_APOLU|nr:hypothetical protein GE061_003381 [Apolygus lucorum]
MIRRPLRPKLISTVEPSYKISDVGEDEFGRPVIVFEGAEFVRNKMMSSTGEEKWKCRNGNCPAGLRTVGKGHSLVITGTENLEESRHVLQHRR